MKTMERNWYPLNIWNENQQVNILNVDVHRARLSLAFLFHLFGIILPSLLIGSYIAICEFANFLHTIIEFRLSMLKWCSVFINAILLNRLNNSFHNSRWMIVYFMCSSWMWAKHTHTHTHTPIHQINGSSALIYFGNFQIKVDIPLSNCPIVMRSLSAQFISKTSISVWFDLFQSPSISVSFQYQIMGTFSVLFWSTSISLTILTFSTWW